MLVSSTQLVGDIKIEKLTLGAELRRTIKSGGKVRHIVCHPKNRICFLVTDNHVIVHYGLQTFVLEPVECPGDLWRRRLNKIRADVLSRRIRTLDGLLFECGVGVNLVPTRMSYHV